MAWFAPPVLAETRVYQPMELWFGTGVRTLGWPVAAPPQPDPDDPVELLKHGARVATGAGYELDYHDRNNDSYGTSTSVLGLLREPDPASRPWALAVLSGRSKWRFEALDGGKYDARQDASREAASAATRVGANGFIGVGLARDEGDAAPVLGAALDVSSAVRIEIRSVPRRVRLPVSYVDSNDSIDLALTSRRQVNEMAVRVFTPGAGEFAMRMDVNEREHASVRWVLGAIPNPTVTYEYVREENPVASDIRVNGESSGEVFGAFSRTAYGVLVAYRGDGHDGYGGLQKSTLRLDLNGGVSDNDLIDLWAYLLPGERRFKARYAVDVLQWFAGTQSRVSDAWTTRLGAHYVIARANGNFAHWTPIPFLGVGMLDEENKPLSNERTTALAFSLGATYRVARWEISYGVVQLIPLDQSSNTQRDDQNSTAAVARRNNGVARSRRAPDRPIGGHLQRLQLVWNL